MGSYGYKSPAAEKSQIVKKQTNKNQLSSPVSIQTGFSPFSRKLNLFSDFILTDKPKLLPKFSVSNETNLRTQQGSYQTHNEENITKNESAWRRHAS